MAQTFKKLAQVTLSSNYTNVNFTSISQDYTHLVLITSLRQTGAGYYANGFIKLNNTTTGYTGNVLEGTTGSPGGFNDGAGSLTGIRIDATAGGSASTYNYNVSETWFHNYSGSAHKTGFQEIYVPNQTTNQTFIDRRGWHWANTSPITSLYIASSSIWVAGSTITLYGIGQLGSTNTGTATVSVS